MCSKVVLPNIVDVDIKTFYSFVFYYSDNVIYQHYQGLGRLIFRTFWPSRDSSRPQLSNPRETFCYYYVIFINLKERYVFKLYLCVYIYLIATLKKLVSSPPLRFFNIFFYLKFSLSLKFYFFFLFSSTFFLCMMCCGGFMYVRIVSLSRAIFFSSIIFPKPHFFFYIRERERRETQMSTTS